MLRRLVLATVVPLYLVTGNMALACAYSMDPLSVAEVARFNGEDQRLRDTAPKEYMALVQGSHRPFAMPWTRWLKLTASARSRFVADESWEERAWLKAHTNPRSGPSAMGAAVQRWQADRRALWRVVGYGHHYRQGEGTCAGYSYWERRPFALPWPNPSRSSVGRVAKVYGYKLPRNQYERPQFVVLSAQLIPRDAWFLPSPSP